MRVNASRVTELMNQKNLTPERISYKTGLDAVSVKNILKTGYISADAAERIAGCLHVRISDIMMQEPSGSIENCIEFFKDSDRVTFTFTQGRYKSRVMKLARERPDECKILVKNTDGSITGHIPVSWVKISPPKEYSAETIEKYVSNLRKPKDTGHDNG